MCKAEVDIMFVDHGPDIIQPIYQAVDDFFKNFSSITAFLDERSFGIFCQFIEQPGNFFPFGSEI